MPLELSLEDLTSQARTILEQAAQEAMRRATSAVEPIHILFTLLNSSDNLTTQALSKAGVDLSQLRTTVTAQLPLGDPLGGQTPTLGAEAQRVVRSAFKEAVHLGHRRVDVIHLLMGLLYLHENPAAKILANAGVSLYQLREGILEAPKRFQTRARDQLSLHLRPSPIFFGIVALMVLCGVMLWRNPGPSWTGPLTLLFVISGWIVSLCLHEFGHALAAFLGGDTSVGEAGYLTLNPLRYTHPVLSILMPVIFLLMGGIGLPGGAVYVRTGALRNRGWEAMVSAAGPLGTLIFGFLISLPFYFNWQEWVTIANRSFWPALGFLAFLQVTALLFNLLPIPPLDGFNLLATQFSPALRRQLLGLGNIGFFLLLFLFSRQNPVSDGFWRLAFWLASWLQIPNELVALGYQQFTWWR